MGAGGSTTRTLTVKNDNPNVIEVTSDVLNRLRHGYPPEVPQQPSATTSTVETKATQEKPLLSPEQAEGQLFLSANSSGHPILETITANQVRKEKEEELRANDIFWQSKLKEIEAKYLNSALNSEQEFMKEVESIRKLLPTKEVPICEDLSPKVIACYAANPNHTLRCADIVKKFTLCVEQSQENRTVE